MEQKTKKPYTNWIITTLVGLTMVTAGLTVVTGGFFHDILLIGGAVVFLYGLYQTIRAATKK